MARMKRAVGGRLFVSPSEKIYSDQVLSGKVFVGLGQNNGNQTQHISQTYSEFGIVVEAFWAVVKEFMDARYSSGFFMNGPPQHEQLKMVKQ